MDDGGGLPGLDGGPAGLRPRRVVALPLGQPSGVVEGGDLFPGVFIHLPFGFGRVLPPDRLEVWEGTGLRRQPLGQGVSLGVIAAGIVGVRRVGEGKVGDGEVGQVLFDVEGGVLGVKDPQQHQRQRQ